MPLTRSFRETIVRQILPVGCTLSLLIGGSQLVGHDPQKDHTAFLIMVRTAVGKKWLVNANDSQ